MKLVKLIVPALLATLSFGALAQDISGIWQQIDDKSGAAKAIIEIRKESNNTYTGKIVKITPRPGYKPREYCNNCPKPYSNQPILGMDILKGLTKKDLSNSYEKGTIIDPLTGSFYSAIVKIAPNGKRITLRAFLGVSSLGRSQTWIRQD